MSNEPVNHGTVAKTNAELTQEANQASTIGTYGSVGAIASGIALTTLAPIAGIAISAIGAAIGAFFLWGKLNAEQQLHQGHVEPTAVEPANTKTPSDVQPPSGNRSEHVSGH